MDTKELALKAASILALLLMGIGLGQSITATSTLPPEETKKQGEQMAMVGGMIYVASNILN